MHSLWIAALMIVACTTLNPFISATEIAKQVEQAPLEESEEESPEGEHEEEEDEEASN